MRSEKSIKNVIITWVSLGLVSIGGFIIRIALARILGEEYLGLTGLFGNIISVLSLAEMGVGTAITFSLYKPLSEGDEIQIKALMRLYKTFYIGVGIFVLAIGAILTPFLPYLIKEMPQNIKHIYLIFLLYVLNSCFSYFYSYKCVYLSANQNYYIYSMNHASFCVIMYIVQILVLIITRNFILFYIIQVLATVGENLNIARIANKRYPILKSRDKYVLPKETKKTIRINVFAAIGHNIGNVVLNSTDNLVISKFVGLIATGLYTNYLLITSTINMFMNQAFQAILGSVGNLAVEADEKQQKDTFFLIYFVNFWIYGFAAVAILVLANPFIEVAFGTKYVLSFPIVVAICFNFYATGMRQTCIVFKSAYGILIQDVHKAYIEAIVNLVVSVILVQHLGILGVILGTIISNYVVAFWIEPKVFFENSFKKGIGKYFENYVLYLVSGFVFAVIVYALTSVIPVYGIVKIIVDLLVVILLYNVLMCIVWGRTKSFRSLMNIFKRIIDLKLSK